MSSKKRIASGAMVVTALAVATALLAGCSLDRWAAVEPGEYMFLRTSEGMDSADAQGIPYLRIDREHDIVELTLAGGEQLVTSFVPRARSTWPAGCPSNIQSTRMEVLEIVERPLAIGATTFRQPVLVRNCPPDPVQIVLREDGDIGGGGSAYSHLEPCLVFVPRAEAFQQTEPLPHAMKGYELYSWQQGREWHFTLMTGTNRLKQYEEIVSPDSLVTGTEWVKLTVQGTENLIALLDRLPEGEQVSWLGEAWLRQVGADAGPIRLPEGEMIDEIVDACQPLGIKLSVSGQ
jgi:hypothetical protein